MPTTLTTEAVERSTFVIRASFTDETGAAVVPNSGLTWTLSDVRGNVVNSREDVAITSAATITIVLHGDDLALSDAFRDAGRVLTIRGMYNSSLGASLEIADQATFVITNLFAVA
jgi:hypothetical protein